jgi:hypothetical protein
VLNDTYIALGNNMAVPRSRVSSMVFGMINEFAGLGKRNSWRALSQSPAPSQVRFFGLYQRIHKLVAVEQGNL